MEKITNQMILPIKHLDEHKTMCLLSIYLLGVPFNFFKNVIFLDINACLLVICTLLSSVLAGKRDCQSAFSKKYLK